MGWNFHKALTQWRTISSTSVVENLKSILHIREQLYISFCGFCWFSDTLARPQLCPPMQYTADDCEGNLTELVEILPEIVLLDFL